MPHKCGEKYLLECVENGLNSVYEKCIQLSPIRYMTETEDGIDSSKKLLVLSLNGVLCDWPNSNKKTEFSLDLARPHLQTFLESVSKHYNIFIWSSDSMNELLRKADVLGIRDSNRYTISAYLDNTLMQTVVSSHFIRPKQVKNLEVIFKNSNFFNPTNTVMVANERWSLIKNPHNGFLFEPGMHGKIEDVLLTLALFLEKLACDFNNFAEIPLEKFWKMAVQNYSNNEK